MSVNKLKFFRTRQKLNVFFRLLFILSLLVLAYSYAMFQGGFVSWFLFYSFLPFALYSLIVIIYPIQRWKIDRLVPEKTLYHGEDVTFHLTIRRKIPFPLLFLVVEDVLPEPLEGEQHKKLIFPGFRRTIRMSYSLKMKRGEHPFAVVRILIADPLGLVGKEVRINCLDTVLVYPQLEEMIYQPLESRYEHGSSSSRFRIQKDAAVVTGIREYQPGDRFSWIDWKATAKKMDLMSKQFEVKQSNDCLVVLDVRESEFLEDTIRFTASLTNTILRHGGEVGLYTVGDSNNFIPVRSGESQFQRIYLHLAKVKPAKENRFVQSLSEELNLYNQPAVMVIVTSTYDEELLNEVRRKLRRMGRVIVYNIQEHFTHYEDQMMNRLIYYEGFVYKTISPAHFRTALTEVI